MRGASALQDVLNQYSSTDVIVIAVWEPILPTDRARPSTAILSRLSDSRAQQFWDPEHFVAGNLAMTIAKDRDFPRPGCCMNEGFYWDLAAVFPKGVEWNDSLPLATFIDGPVVNVRDALRKAILATK